MKRFLAASLVLALLLGGGIAAVAGAEEDEVTQEDLLKTKGTVHGAGDRAKFRTAYWAAGLQGDMKEIYNRYGYPSARYREEKMGRVEEKWTYLEAGKQFTFSGSKMTRERKTNTRSTSTYNVH
ncbi:hypothetical protein ACFL2Z_05815 [Candidatus Eisenbacteria bacterium]|uniref:DUF4148 domain-containing protein n=1 Tax=Eiseniibacteriota bacterium TaxID=2212470 RepID=A0ABV6YQN7_UNCEI